MSNFWSSMAKRAQPYVPGEQVNDSHILKLNTNENPYPPSPNALQAMKRSADATIRLYPSPTTDDLREVIAEQHDVNKDSVFVGNGSDEVLAFAFMAFFEPLERIRFPKITYSFYPVYATLFDIPYEEVPLQEDFTINPEDYFDAEGGVIFPNPNAPTGIFLELDAIETIAQKNPNKVVIIDEAYIDFAPESFSARLKNYNNVLLIQTLSKSRALAGLRVGYAIGHPSLINGLTRMKDSFNSYTIDRVAINAATAAIKDTSYTQEITKKIVHTRSWVTKQLQELSFDVLPSQTNFVCATHATIDAKTLYEQLKKHSILIRHFNQDPIDSYIRITIGTREEMSRFISALTEIIRSA
ncbi:MAG TPA: histidinol-phosphate transaminase [Bacillota bacterium]|nr:histidinol-phosphate transaminase [Bacillota bacterium]